MSSGTYKINTEQLKNCIYNLAKLIQKIQIKETDTVSTKNAGQAHFWMQEIDNEIREAQGALETLALSTKSYAESVLKNVEENDKSNAGGGFR